MTLCLVLPVIDGIEQLPALLQHPYYSIYRPSRYALVSSNCDTLGECRLRYVRAPTGNFTNLTVDNSCTRLDLLLDI
jgi:hypothetical protein